MAVIGTYGPLVFEVSSNKIQTINDIERDNKERWHNHELDGLKPIPEYIGPGLDEMSFTIEFSAFLGVNPLNEMDRLVRMSRNGEKHPLVIGGKGFGFKKWYIESVGQTIEEIDNKGRILTVKSKVKLVEDPW